MRRIQSDHFMMNLGFKSVVAGALLISGMVAALAQPDAGERARGAFEDGNVSREPGRSDGRTAFRLPENSGFGATSENYARTNGYDQQRGRMSPEDRRTLRRQIDEVGHDIYAPKR